jgi:hypothetical protein
VGGGEGGDQGSPSTYDEAVQQHDRVWMLQELPFNSLDSDTEMSDDDVVV